MLTSDSTRELAVLVWLVRRVAYRDQRALTLAALLAAGMFVVVLLGLGSASVLHVALRQHDRAAAMTVRLDPSQSSGTRDDLRMIDPRVTNSRRWDGREIRREFYAAGVRSRLVPPGVPAVPAAGQFYASPDLVRLIESDHVVGSLFSSWRLVGEVAPEGLTQPHELRAVLGVSDDAALLVKVLGFGGRPAANVADDHANPALDASVAAYVLALVWLPAGFFVVIVARLASARRHVRASALYLIGCSKRRVLILHLVEAMGVCLPSALAASVLFSLLTRSMTHLPGTSFGFYASDARLAWPLVATISLVLLSVMCGVVSKDVRHRRSRRDEEAQPQTGRWVTAATTCLIAGFVLLALPALTPLPGAVVPATLWSGMVLTALGIAGAGPRMVTLLLARALDRVSAGALVGRRMASFRVTTALRLASIMSVIVVLLLGSQAFAAVLNGGSPQDWSNRAEAERFIPVTATALSGSMSLSQVSAAAGTDAVAELRSVATSTASLDVVVGSCRGLLALTGARDGQCDDDASAQWIGEPPPPEKRDGLGALLQPSGERLRLADVVGGVHIPGLPDPFAGALLLGPQQAPRPGPADGATFFLLVRGSDLTATLARIAALDPTVQIDLGSLDRHNPDTQTYPAQVEWLGVGAVVSLLLAFLALLVVSIGEAEERSQRMRSLRLLGASRRTLLASHLWCVAVPILVVGAASVLVGWLVVQSMRNIDDRAYVPATLYGATVGGVLLAAVVIAVATWRAVHRPSQQAGTFTA